jgi:EAL domain-containing protein (putative c-di-GMP-specific phosphodiesterase class I)/CheY-like chemotaxis protein
MSNSQRSEAGPHSTDQLAAEQTAAGKPEESQWAAGQLAYVLDDEPQVRAIVRKILASIGFLSQEFTGPVALFAEMKKTSPELIVLDLALGQSDAVEVIRYLETFRYKGGVLLISGRDYATLSEIRHIGEQRGLTMLPPVQKPFRAADIKNSLVAAAKAREGRPPSKGPAADPSDKGEAWIDPVEALQNRWLTLWYQAKIDLKTLTVSGAEALLRVRHPERGIVSPTNFLPARNSGVYQPLTKFVVLQAMADWENFAEQGQPLKLSINVPLSTLQLPSFVELIRNARPKRPNFPGLIIEVTEGEMLLDPSGIREIATQLKLYNVAVAIDDFGGARSSLALLRDLPCVELNLDRGCVSGCATDSAKQLVCAAAIELAHGFGLTVCAKGVENVEDLRTLIDLGCHSVQGFLFAKPLDPVSFVKMLIGRSAESARQAGIRAAMCGVASARPDGKADGSAIGR